MPLANVIRLDFDMKYTCENILRAIENILFASCVTDIPVRKIYMRRSYSGNIHAYVHTHKINTYEHIVFEYFAMSDRARVFANYRRMVNDYPSIGIPTYLFGHYYIKPCKKVNEYIELPIWDILLSYSVNNYNCIGKLYNTNPKIVYDKC